MLKLEFERYPDWCKDVMSEIAAKTGLSEAQVYKWGWDQKKKIQFKARPKPYVSPSLSDLYSTMPKIGKKVIMVGY